MLRSRGGPEYKGKSVLEKIALMLKYELCNPFDFKSDFNNILKIKVPRIAIEKLDSNPVNLTLEANYKLLLNAGILDIPDI